MLGKAREIGNLGRGDGVGGEHKPGTNGNANSAVKKHAETGHDIHPNYANIVETDVNSKTKRLFQESLHSFLDKNSVNEKDTLPKGLRITGFLPRG